MFALQFHVLHDSTKITIIGNYSESKLLYGNLPQFLRIAQKHP